VTVTEWTVPAHLVRIVDGDTIVCELDLGWNIHLTGTIRLLGINAPEMRTPEGVAARDFLATQVAPGDPVVVVSTRLLGNTEKYGRCLASVRLASGADISTTMLSTGHAISYNPG
jgi:endonuclease YncB( thermonuclease family)